MTSSAPSSGVAEPDTTAVCVATDLDKAEGRAYIAVEDVDAFGPSRLAGWSAPVASLLLTRLRGLSAASAGRERSDEGPMPPAPVVSRGIFEEDGLRFGAAGATGPGPFGVPVRALPEREGSEPEGPSSAGLLWSPPADSLLPCFLLFLRLSRSFLYGRVVSWWPGQRAAMPRSTHLSQGQGVREHLSLRRMHSRHDLALLDRVFVASSSALTSVSVTG